MDRNEMIVLVAFLFFLAAITIAGAVSGAKYGKARAEENEKIDRIEQRIDAIEKEIGR